MSNLATALAIQNATQDSVNDDEVILHAKVLLDTFSDTMPSDAQLKALFRYSSMLAATVADKVTQVLMTESEFISMLHEIGEMVEMSNEIVGE